MDKFVQICPTTKRKSHKKNEVTTYLIKATASMIAVQPNVARQSN